MSELQSHDEIVLRLWMILDWIDTLDDACRSNDADFRDQVRVLVRKRHFYVEPSEIDALIARFGETDTYTEKTREHLWGRANGLSDDDSR